MKFGKEEFRTLGLTRDDGRYTNLALLLSDQCEHSIKVAVFKGKSKREFFDRREFGGSLFSQLNEASYYIGLFNHLPAKIVGYDRVEKHDYPEDGLRECLLNAIIHRDYSYSGSILVNIYDDRIEFVSLGGIAGGLPLETLLSGISQTRNDELASIFYRLRYVEAYGTGIPRILDVYSQEESKPIFFATSSSFSVTLPNRNVEVIKEKIDLGEKEELVLKILKDKGSLDRKTIMEEASLGATRSYEILNKLKQYNLVEVEKKGRKEFYKAK